MQWTDDQRNAIYAPPAEIIVSAAAGSGKTQVLTTRIIERIKSDENPVSVDRLLIVTFTKAAAAEMRERIGKALAAAVKSETDDKKRRRLSRQLTLLSGASICTIDAFCFNIVRQNYYRVNLPADVRIGDTGETALLQIDALEKTADAFYSALAAYRGEELSESAAADGDIIKEMFPDEAERGIILEGFEMLERCYSSDKSDSDFSGKKKGGDYTKMISELYKKAQSAAFPDKWLGEIADAYSRDYAETPFYSLTVRECRAMAESLAQMAENAADFSESCGLGYETVFREACESFRAAAEKTDYDSLRACFSSYSSVKLPRRKSGSAAEDADVVKAIRAKMDKIGERCAELLELSYDECAAVQKKLYPMIKALCAAAKALGRIYSDKMTERKILDFPACEHLALEIITADGKTLTEAGAVIRDSFDEIYIDEMQDSNDLQDTLFSAISSGAMFMVGDVKQSIYGFRSADPSIFTEKCDSSSEDKDAEKRKIFLSRNFRSRRNVISAVNSVFDIIMRTDVCGIDYIKEHRLDFGADFMQGAENERKTEIDVVHCAGNAAELCRAEAEFTAAEIEKTVAEKRLVWDKDESVLRPARYCDFAILMRAPGSAAEVYEQALSLRGIPSYYEDGGSLYTSGEVGAVLELLKLIDNSECDVPLASAMRSPMFMFGENELLAIRLCGGGSFKSALDKVCGGETDVSSALREKCVSFMQSVGRWRRAAGFVSVEELIRRIYAETNIAAAALAFPDGEKRRANLDLLLERAAEFESTNLRGLFNFVNYVTGIQQSGGSAAEAKSMSEKMDVVRITSIHKSKGLEFPIVYLVGCEKAYHGADNMPGGMIISRSTGVSINVTDPDLRFRFRSPMQRIAALTEKTSAAAEEMRLLYVALTRAREELHAVCAVKKPESFSPLGYTPAPYEILFADSYQKLLKLSVNNRWNVRYIEAGTAEESEAYEGKQEISFTADERVSRLLDYSYPYSAAVTLPNKASVSQLKEEAFNLLYEADGTLHSLNRADHTRLKLKKLKTKREITGAFFGTAHHKMLEHLLFDGTPVKAQLEELHSRGILSDEEYDITDAGKIEKFVGSPLGRRMGAAKKLNRESPFVISIPAAEIEPSLPENETICVQGVIDCWFEENDRVVLVDYKTDAYENPSEIAEKYKKQLSYYERALQSKFNNKLIEKYLYLLHKDDIISI